MKKTFLSAVKAMCAGVMTLCMASLTFVSCYDDSDLQNKVKDMEGRLAIVEELAEALQGQVDAALYTLEFQVSSSNELQYSFDGGKTWQATGVTATAGVSVADVEDGDDTITFVFSDGSSFTIEKPIEVQFEIRSGKVYFGEGENKTIKVLSAGISDLTVISQPKGWYATINADGNVVVTPPADDDADGSGYIKVHACSEEGKCYVGRVAVELSLGGTCDLSIYAYDGQMDLRAGYASTKFFFGVSTRESFKSDAEALLTTVKSALAENKWGLLESIENSAYAFESVEGYDGTLKLSLSEIYGSELELGKEYIVWAFLEDLEDFTIDNVVAAYYTNVPVSITAEEDVAKRTLRESEIKINVTGADSYKVSLIKGTELVPYDPSLDAEAFRAEMLQYSKEEFISGLDHTGVELFENYSGPISAFKAKHDSDPLAPAVTNVLLIIALDGRPRDCYTTEDIVVLEATTGGYTPGGTINVTADILTEGTYTHWYQEKTVNLQEAIAASVSIAEGSEWAELYYGFVSDAIWEKCAGEDQKLVDHFSVNSWPTTPDYMETGFPLYDAYSDLEMDPSQHFVAFAVDANGKYGEVVKLNGEGLVIAGRQWMLPAEFMETMGLGAARSVLDFVTYANMGYLLIGVSYEDIYGEDAAGVWMSPPNFFGSYEIEPATSTTGTLILKAMSMVGENIIEIPYSELTTNTCKFDFCNYTGEETSAYTATLATELVTVQPQG